MSRIDVLKSLVRSGLRSAASGLRNLPTTAALERAFDEASFNRQRVSDAQLTAAVARAVDVEAATVSTSPRGIRVDLSFANDAHLLFTVRRITIAFATGGAKELAFELEPNEALRHPRCADVSAVLAAEIARTLWRPVLLRAPRNGQGSFVSTEHDRLVVDLRSVPEVRWALSQKLPSAMIQLIRLRAIELEDGGVVLRVGLDR